MKVIVLIAASLAIGGCCHQSNSEFDLNKSSSPEEFNWSKYRRLTGAEILQAFGGVADNATVMDGAGGKSTNYWYANGRFSSDWTAGIRSGKLSGAWFVENDMRCVVLDIQIDGLPLGEKRCGPIYFKEGRYYSVNNAGQVHGVHILEKLEDG